MNKKGIVESALVWWIIAIVIFIIMVVAFIFLRNTDLSIIESFKNLFRFR